MTKKFFISTAIIVLTACGLYAQDVNFGVRGGLNMSNLIATGNGDSPMSDGYNSRMATGFGIFTELQFNRTVSMRFGLEYSGMGGKKDGMQPFPSQRLISEIASDIGLGMTAEQQQAIGMFAGNMPQYYYADVNNTIKLDYLMIPIVAQFGWTIGHSPVRLYINAGPFVSFLLSGKQAAEGKSRLYTDETGTTTMWEEFADKFPAFVPFVQSEFPKIEPLLNDVQTFGETNITAEFCSTNFGVIGNAGIRFQFHRHAIFVEAGGNYGFFTVQQKEINGSNRAGAASVMLGYAFSLF